MSAKHDGSVEVSFHLDDRHALALAKMLLRMHDDDFERISTSQNEAQDMRDGCFALERGLRRAGIRPRS